MDLPPTLLKELDMQMSLPDLITFLHPPFPTARLQRLSIKTQNQEKYANISRFLEPVANSCPNIQSLEVAVYRTNREDTYQPLPFTALEPLLVCESLTSLSIVTPLLLDLENAHITWG